MAADCQLTGQKPGYGKQVIDKRGVESVVAKLRAKGQRI